MKVQKLTQTAQIPTKATPHSGGFDLYSDQELVIPAGGRALVKTGIAVEIAEDCVAMVCPRSGMALNGGITVLNAPGIIDADYRGEVGVILYNTTGDDAMVWLGDRIAQLVLTVISVEEAEEILELTDTERGEDGFGSSGE